jgi:uncharacterized membrane protein
MVNPFDPRSFLLAKHAQHVVLIHFPIALFMTGVGLDLLSGGKRHSQFASAAYLNLCVAAVDCTAGGHHGACWPGSSLLMARAQGVVAMACRRGLDCRAIGDCILVGALASAPIRTIAPRYRMPVELLGVAFIALTAHVGGFLSGVNQ